VEGWVIDRVFPEKREETQQTVSTRGSGEMAGQKVGKVKKRHKQHFAQGYGKREKRSTTKNGLQATNPEAA